MATKWTLVQPQILLFANMKWPVQHILFGAFHIDPEPLLCISLLTKLNCIFFRSSSCCTAWLHKLQKYLRISSQILQNPDSALSLLSAE